MREDDPRPLLDDSHRGQFHGPVYEDHCEGHAGFSWDSVRQKARLELLHNLQVFLTNHECQAKQNQGPYGPGPGQECNLPTFLLESCSKMNNLSNDTLFR